MDERIREVVVLGGGTAGWMTASYLAKSFQGQVNITVLEAPAIPRIGVGEATVPNLQSAFFDHLGIPEEDWMREVNASFKAGIKFINWNTPGEGGTEPRPVDTGTDHFYHVFGHLPEIDGIPLSHYWLNQRKNGETSRFDYTCFPETAALHAKRGPRFADGRQATGYAWHFDANLVADFLRRFATEKLGVRHVEGTMKKVLLDDRGFITGLDTAERRRIEGDLFVDCSGFRGLLINEAMGEPFLDMGDQLLCDSAVATAIDHDDAANGVEPYTSSIAMKAGWTWKIPMLGRFGTGYVYSSRFAGQDEATADFCRLWGIDPAGTEFNHVRFRVGRNRRAWVKNCVSIGLSSCFVEPLESTGIFFIYGAARQLAKHFPDKRFDQVLIDRFNAEVESMFSYTRDFLQAHFYFSPRTDTPFWRANKNLALGKDILEKIEIYRAGLPVNPSASGERVIYGNSEVDTRNYWNNTNYYCVFAGLGELPDEPMPALAYKREAQERAAELFGEYRRRSTELVAELPSTYDYLRRLHGK